MSPPPLRRRDRLLQAWLRLLGCLDLLAFSSVVMPNTWFDYTNAFFGVGPFPHEPIVHYLVRSGPLLYAFHGTVLLFLSTDVNRYRPVIRFFGWGAIVQGAILVGIDTVAAMPTYWLLMEGPGFAAAGAVILVLSSVRTAPGDSQAANSTR
jgi:hypothetical protein